MEDAVLLRQAIDLGADIEHPDKTGATPFLFAATYARANCMQVLVDAGATITARGDRSGRQSGTDSSEDAPEVSGQGLDPARVDDFALGPGRSASASLQVLLYLPAGFSFSSVV